MGLNFSDVDDVENISTIHDPFPKVRYEFKTILSVSHCPLSPSTCCTLGFLRIPNSILSIILSGFHSVYLNQNLSKSFIIVLVLLSLYLPILPADTIGIRITSISPILLEKFACVDKSWTK